MEWEMKKLLFGTTALVGAVAFTNAASAQSVSVGGALDLTISGYSEFEIEYADEDLGFTDGSSRQVVDPATGEVSTESTGSPREWFFNQDHEIRFLAVGVGDATGITYGIDLQLENAGGTDAGFDEAFIFFSGNFGRVQLGDEDGALSTLTISAVNVQRGTAGLDGGYRAVPSAFLFDSGEATKATYFTPNVAGFQAGVSYAIDADDRGTNGGENDVGDVFEFGANWQGTFANFDLGAFGGLTYADASGSGGDSGTAWTIGGLVGFAGFDLAGAYGDETGTDGVSEGNPFGDGARENFWQLGVGTEFAGVGVSVGYQRDTYAGGVGGAEPTTDTYVISADTGILPGVSLQGDVAYVDTDQDAAGVDDPDGVNAILRTNISF
jgi:hypothetical protein